MFIAALLTIAKIWKQPKCPSTDEWIDIYGVYIQLNIIQPWERRKSCNLWQHDGPLGHYAKWHKPDRET